VECGMNLLVRERFIGREWLFSRGIISCRAFSILLCTGEGSEAY
jgi:hypothetical protein